MLTTKLFQKKSPTLIVSKKAPPLKSAPPADRYWVLLYTFFILIIKVVRFFLGVNFCPKSKIDGHPIHCNQGKNFYNELKWPYLWVVLENELKLYTIHIVKGVFFAKFDKKMFKNGPRVNSRVQLWPTMTF